jgi:aminoglycoside 6'-N-acetyltransferase I
VSIEIRVLGGADASVLANVAPEVFDHPIDAGWTAEFLADARHHLAVALDAGLVVGMASGVHYVHPDKPPELWVNEVGVASTHAGQGIGRRLLGALFERAGRLGCSEAWVLTDHANVAAQRLYAAAGGKETHEQPVMFTFRLGAGGTAAEPARSSPDTPRGSTG